jgi:hypothetical protein
MDNKKSTKDYITEAYGPNIVEAHARQGMSTMRQFEYDTAAATAMADKEWGFALNSQMKPLRCIITAVHLYKDRPKFDIDFNVDPGGEKDETDYTKLRNVGAQFLFSPIDKSKVLGDIAGLTSEATQELNANNVEGVAAQLRVIWNLANDNC